MNVYNITVWVIAQASLAWPDRFFIFLCSGTTIKKMEKSDLAMRDCSGLMATILILKKKQVKKLITLRSISQSIANKQ